VSPLPPRTEIAQKNTIRLISTGRLKQPVLLALAANHGALEDLAELEGATSGRLMAQKGGLFDLDPRELVFGSPGHTFINAAFTYTRPGGSRFNSEERGAWYCGFAVETSLAEVAYHLTRELEAVGRFENVTDYAELIADFIGAFHDLRGDEFKDSACLGADIAAAYPAGQALATQLRMEEQGIGILYPSVRHKGGTCLAGFHPGLVQNLRQGGVWRLEWKGERKAVVTAM
jgi:RES domain-containing protein